MKIQHDFYKMLNQHDIENDYCQPNQVVGYCQDEHGYSF